MGGREGKRERGCWRKEGNHPFLHMCSWEGKDETEKGLDKATGKVRVQVDPKYYRPTEVVSVSMREGKGSRLPTSHSGYDLCVMADFLCAVTLFQI